MDSGGRRIQKTAFHCALRDHFGERAVPLDHVDRPGYENRQGVHFPMMHNDTIIRILVTREVLQGVASSLPGDGSDIARFEAHRKEFEAIASDKFDHGQFKGTMKIARDDVLKFVTERLNSR